MPVLSCLTLPCRWLLAALLLTPAGVVPSRGQGYNDPAAPEASSVNVSDPSELYLRAYTSVQQAEKLEQEGNLRPALAKYRFAASMLDQLTQSNPNWQPLIVKYRQRKTTESIQKLEEKGVVLQNPAPNATAQLPVAPSASYGTPQAIPTRQPAGPPMPDDDLPAPDNASGQPMPRNNGPVNVTPAGVQPQQPIAPPIEVMDRNSQALRTKLEKAQKELKSALDALAKVKQEKQEVIKQKDEIEGRMESARAEVKIAQSRFERTKSNRDELQADLAKAEARLKDAVSKNPAVAQSRKEIRNQVEELRKQLAKAQEETESAAKARDELKAKFETGELALAQVTKERDAALARNELAKDSINKIETLQNENNLLTQKLSNAESSITKLTAESTRKKQELDGMQKELTTLRDQLTSTRDQNDRAATTITALRAQLDEGAKRIDELKARGTSNEDFAKMSKENEMLRGIVVRQLKEQSRRAAVKNMIADELARLDIQNSTLNRQLESLGQPSAQLTDEERALFKDPTVTISADSMAATITTVRPRQPGQPPAPDGTAAPDTQNQPPDGVQPALNTNKNGPQVSTAPKPRVSEELLPMAREAMESFSRQQYAEAERTYEKLLARDPKNAYLLSNQGVVLFRQDKLKSAEVMLKKAVQAAPGDAFGRATLGIVYYRMHRYDEALENLTTALQIDPKNATAYNYLGITASQKGFSAAAIEEIQKAIALNPNYADAHFNLAVVFATKQPPDKARAKEHYNIAMRLGASPDPTLEKLIGN